MDSVALGQDRLRLEIEKRIAVLKAASQSTEDDLQPVELDQSSVERLSRMDSIQRQAMSLASERRREASLQKLEAALRRLVNGNYGYCIVCEEEIPAKRLGADPAVPTCLHCAIKTG